MKGVTNPCGGRRMIRMWKHIRKGGAIRRTSRIGQDIGTGLHISRFLEPNLLIGGGNVGRKSSLSGYLRRNSCHRSTSLLPLFFGLWWRFISSITIFIYPGDSVSIYRLTIQTFLFNLESNEYYRTKIKIIDRIIFEMENGFFKLWLLDILEIF